VRCVLSILFLTTLAAAASDWPQWRGPAGQGHCTDIDLPLTWGGPANENVIWKSALPASDTSQASPIVCKDRVFAVTAKNRPVEHHVSCYNATSGEKLWTTLVEPGPWLLTDLRGGYACSTPSTDGERVYVVFGSSVIAALDYEGKVVWRKAIEPRNFDVAISSSPLVYNGTVLLLCDQNNKSSFLIAYDAKTGEMKWQVQRPDAGFNHSTPLLTRVNGADQLLVPASNALQGVDPANGKVLWWCQAKGDVCTPVLSNNLVYSDDGRGGPGVCVDPSGSGDVTKTHVKWSQKGRTNGMNSPLAVGEHLYKLSSNVRCIALATGEEIWSEKLGGDFNPSPIATADGRIYYASAGPSWVFREGAKFELLGKSDLGEPSSCSPAVANGRLYLKGSKSLFCIGKNNPK
jgi:outer membrane protein assembly factor BamB